MKLTPDEEAALREIEFHLTAPHTLQEIADFTGKSLRWIAVLEARALRKLRDLVDEDWRGPLVPDDRVGYVESAHSIVKRTGNGISRPTTKLRK